MKTIYLHIGMPKTGTSALQTFLAANRKTLALNGICYPRFSVRFPEVGPNRNGHFLKYVQSRNSAPESYQKCMQELKAALAEHDQVLLSEEAIWGKQTKHNWWLSVSKWAAELGVQLKLIVYLRRQEDLIESLWNQKIKGFQKWTVTFSEFLEQELYLFLPLDYEKILLDLEAQFGPENLIVRPYDRAAFSGGTIFQDFLEAIGLAMTDDYVIERATMNPSLPTGSVELKRLINQNHAYQNAKGVNFYYDVIMDAYPASSGAEKQLTFFSPEELAAIRARYAPGNEAVARRYLHKPDGVLFTPAAPAETWTGDTRDLLQETVRVFTGADLYLYQEIQALKEENKQLKAQINQLKWNIAYRIGAKLSELKHGKK